LVEGKEIPLKNNKSPLQPRRIEQFTIPRVKMHWPVIIAIALNDPRSTVDARDQGRPKIPFGVTPASV
jgi:hypothetical protein